MARRFAMVPKQSPLFRRLILVGSLWLPAACDESRAPSPAPTKTPETRPSAAGSTAPSAPASSGAAPARVVGNAARGKKLVEEFECHRCHDGTGLEPVALTRHCVHCHEEISQGKVKAAPATLAKWKKNVAYVRYTPSLHGLGARLRAGWVAEFLTNPTDLRPALEPSMPRLAVSEQQAADIAAHLTAGAPPDGETTFEKANLGAGRRLYEAKACGRCHEFSGASAPGDRPNLRKAATEADRKAILLAPDLRHARTRFRRDALERWLRNPTELKKDTSMPNHGLAPDEAKNLARFVLEAPLEPVAPRVRVSRPEVPETPVDFAVVKERVLSKTCGHCHGNPDVALGDGGPGHTGGFGFPPRKLDLTRYGSIASGYVAEDGERHSIFEPLKDGTPRLVASLLARHDETRGMPRPDVRGMPLGLPPIPLEDIALVDAWIQQGRPR